MREFVDISVIVVTFNSALYVERCVESLLAQTVSASRIVVVDNGSTDGTCEKLARFGGQIHLVQNSVNLGFALGNTIGADMCHKSTYIALLNPDAFAAPNWLESLESHARGHPHHSFFASAQFVEGEEKMVDGFGDALHISGVAWRRGYQKKITVDQLQSKFFSPCGAAAMYKTSDFLRAGGFDQDFFCYFEDIDLVYRMRLLGMTGSLAADAHVNHIGSATSGGRHSEFSVYYGHRNMVWSFVKNTPLPLMVILVIPHILMTVAMVVAHAFSGRARVIIRAKLDALAGLPSVLRKRQAVQVARVISSIVLLKVLSVRGLLSRR